MGTELCTEGGNYIRHLWTFETVLLKTLADEQEVFKED